MERCEKQIKPHGKAGGEYERKISGKTLQKYGTYGAQKAAFGFSVPLPAYVCSQDTDDNGICRYKA